MDVPWRIRKIAEEMESVKEGEVAPVADLFRWAEELRRIVKWLEYAGIEKVPPG